jgi:hypothetical protein
MNTKKTIFFLLMVVCCVANAQIIFQKTIGGSGDDVANCVKQTLDGGYIIVGYTSSFGAGLKDVYAIKTDKFGDTVWTRTYGGVNDDVGNAVVQNADSTYVIVGSTLSFGAGQQNVYVIKINSNGDTLWTRTYGGTSLESGNDIKALSPSGYIITGYTFSFGAGEEDAYLIKINNSGDTLWTRTFGGENGNEAGNSVSLTSTNGYVITGYTTTFGAGGYDIYIITTNSAGTVTGTIHTYGGALGDEYGNCGIQTSDGGLILCGSTTSFGNGFDDMYIIKTDVDGTIQHQKTFGGTSYDVANCVGLTVDGGYIFVGSTQSFGNGNQYVYLIKTDASLTENFSKIIGGSGFNQGNSVMQTSDGGYIVAGSTKSFGQGGWDVYLIKTDANGYSGCNVFPASYLNTVPSTQINATQTLISTGGIISKDSTLVSFGGKDSTICFEWEGIPEVPFNRGESYLYPNPSNGETHLNIQSPDQLNYAITVQLYDVLGRELNIQFSKENTTTNSIQLLIKTGDVPQGIYFIKTTIGQNIYNNIISIY